jgi:hypothetical protein
MTDGNTNLSTTALAAIKRIRTLRQASRRTGLATTTEQANVLLALNDTDILAASAVLAEERAR